MTTRPHPLHFLICQRTRLPADPFKCERRDELNQAPVDVSLGHAHVHWNVVLHRG